MVIKLLTELSFWSFDELFSLRRVTSQIARERNQECADPLSDVEDVKQMCVVLDE